MKYLYSLYNLILQSPFPLAEVISCNGTPDVLIRLEKLDPLQFETLSEGIDFRVTPDGVFLFWKNEAGCFIRDGKEIIIDPHPGVDERVLLLIILGPALAILLHQRGQLALHAAAVEIDGNAVAVMGAPGCGKSALAGVLYGRGHTVMADDLTAIQYNGADIPFAIPGFPQLKLWPEIVTALGKSPEALPCIEPGTEKRSLIPSRFSNKPAPLKKIYVLDGEQTKHTMLLSPQDALLEVIRHSYRAPLLKWIGAQRHLYQCARLVNTVPVCRLNGPISPSSLPDAATIVEHDLTT
jgi:hypothetical protein